MRLYDYAASANCGEVLAQSSAILWLLADDTPFLPADRLGRAREPYPPNARQGMGRSIYD